MTRVLLVGCGYWGAKLAERLDKLLDPGDLQYADTNPEIKGAYLKYESALRDYFDACVIATPSSTHYEIAKQCLEAGKHVLVEKPMTLDYTQACELVELAQSKKLTLMTDSTFLYTNAILGLSRIAPSKEGVVRFPKYNLHFTWTGHRYGNTPEGILWTYGPHPVSIALALMKSPVIAVWAHKKGTSTSLYLTFAGERTATILLDWDTPTRRRELLIEESSRLHFVNLMSPNATTYQQADPLTNMCKMFLRRCKAEEPFKDYNGLETVMVLEETARKDTMVIW